jgi:peptide-methionine (S)-S-oxide reductase
MRQGNDMGTSYRSIILTANDEQARFAEMSRDAYQAMLSAAGFGQITTEIAPAGPFYYAEAYHQQYLDKNPRGYCPNHATGVKLPDGFVVTPLQFAD